MLADGHAPIAQDSIYSALARAQAKMGAALKDAKNPHFGSDFASLVSVRDTITEPLTSEGIACFQPLFNGPEGEIGVRTVLAYGATGETLESELMLALGNAKNAAQEAGKLITYLRRYALMSMTGIAPADDDGNSLQGTKPAKKSTASAKREGDFQAFSEKVRLKGEDGGAQAIRDWINSPPMKSWLRQFSKAFADGCVDEAEAQAKALDAKPATKRATKRSSKPYAEQGEEALQREGLIAEFNEFCEACNVPSEIMTEAERLKALPELDLVVDQDRIDDIASARIEELQVDA